LKKNQKIEKNAKELLEHPFIKNCQPTSILPDLIERKKKYRIEHPESNTIPQREVFKWKWPNPMDESPEIEKGISKSRRKKRVSRKRKSSNNGEQSYIALDNFLYPSFKKMIERTDSNTVLTQIAELKKAFDIAEEKKPGFSDRFVSIIVESLK